MMWVEHSNDMLVFLLPIANVEFIIGRMRFD
jgi:hypothetical protein